jgi:hypothetical protein
MLWLPVSITLESIQSPETKKAGSAHFEY